MGISMSNKSNHAGKSEYQKNLYKALVNQTNCEQTTNEQLDFDSSDSHKLLDSTEEKIQKEPIKYRIQSYFEQHKFEIIMTLITAIVIPLFIYFAITLNRESGQHDKQIEYIENSISEIKTDIKDEAEIVNKLRMTDVENSKEIEFLKTDVERIQRKIETLENTIKEK